MTRQDLFSSSRSDDQQQLFFMLPPEVHCHIWSYIDFKHVFTSIHLVCKEWNKWFRMESRGMLLKLNFNTMPHVESFIKVAEEDLLFDLNIGEVQIKGSKILPISTPNTVSNTSQIDLLYSLLAIHVSRNIVFVLRHLSEPNHSLKQLSIQSLHRLLTRESPIFRTAFRTTSRSFFNSSETCARLVPHSRQASNANSRSVFGINLEGP